MFPNNLFRLEHVSIEKLFVGAQFSSFLKLFSEELSLKDYNSSPKRQGKNEPFFLSIRTH
jgi:hypothetical protein